MPCVESYLKRYAACARGVRGLASCPGRRARRGAARHSAGGAHVFDVAKRVVHRDHFGAILQDRGAADEAADAAKAGDAHLHHGCCGCLWLSEACGGAGRGAWALGAQARRARRRKAEARRASLATGHSALPRANRKSAVFAVAVEEAPSREGVDGHTLMAAPHLVGHTWSGRGTHSHLSRHAGCHISIRLSPPPRARTAKRQTSRLRE